MKYIYIITITIAYSYITTKCPNDGYVGFSGLNICNVKHNHTIIMHRDSSFAFKDSKKAWAYRDTMWYKNDARIDSVLVK